MRTRSSRYRLSVINVRICTACYILPPVRPSVCPSVTQVLCGRICHTSGRNFSDGSNNDSCSSSASAVYQLLPPPPSPPPLLIIVFYSSCVNFLQLLQPLHFCCGTSAPATVSESSIVPRLLLPLPKLSLLLSALQCRGFLNVTRYINPRFTYLLTC